MTVGKTQDAGWQVGVSTTVPHGPPAVWEFMTGAGLPLWLGADRLGDVGSSWRGRDASGEVRSLTEHVRVRLTHRRDHEAHETTVQIGLRPAKRGTTIVFHQERLTGPEDREDARAHWKAIAAKVSAAMQQGT